MKKAMIKKCAVAGFLACLIFSMAVRLMAFEGAGEQDYSLICEKALVLCEINALFITWDFLSCILGFGYCEKYIEPYLRYLKK